MDKHEMEKKDSASNLVELIDARVNRATDAALDKLSKPKTGSSCHMTILLIVLL